MKDGPLITKVCFWLCSVFGCRINFNPDIKLAWFCDCCLMGGPVPMQCQSMYSKLRSVASAVLPTN